MKSEFTENLCNDIEVITRGQAINQEWKNQRMGRITASNAYHVLHVKSPSPNHSLLKNILGKVLFLETYILNVVMKRKVLHVACIAWKQKRDTKTSKFGKLG